MSDPRNQQLEVELTEGRLVISIGIDTLLWAVGNAPHLEHLELEFTDPDRFAGEIVSALGRESETGETPVHRILDEAAEYAVEYGAFGALVKGIDK